MICAHLLYHWVVCGLYTGELQVSLNVAKKTNVVSLNSCDIVISKASLDQNGSTMQGKQQTLIFVAVPLFIYLFISGYNLCSVVIASVLFFIYIFVVFMPIVWRALDIRSSSDLM